MLAWVLACGAPETPRPPPCAGWLDNDGDGFVVAVGEGCPALAADCNDDAADVFPGAPETCDGRDEDCDGSVDEELEDPDAVTVWPDRDADGFGDDAGPLACDVAAGLRVAYAAGDCDDLDRSVHEGALELCDRIDNDCDGVVDDAGFVSDAPTSWWDGDGDGDGDPNIRSSACLDLAAGWVANFEDCDDADPALAGEDCPPPPPPVIRELEEARAIVRDSYLPFYDTVYAPGDLDGDGRDDLVPAGFGAARFFSGVGEDLDGIDAPSTVLGGGTVTGVVTPGDVDGDDILDVAVAFDETLGVFRGPLPLGLVDIDDAGLLFHSYGVNAFEQLAPAGDGALWAGSKSGVFLLDASGVGRFSSAESTARVDVASPQIASGDLDGDGVVELVAGAPTRFVDGFVWIGTVWIVPPDLGGEVRVEDVAQSELVGDQEFGSVGIQVDVGPDVDGDGLEDALVRTLDWRAFLVSDPPPGETAIVAEAASLLFVGPDHGFAPTWERWRSLPGDLDGDGFGDVAISVLAPRSDGDRNEVIVAYGPLAGTVDLKDASRWVNEGPPQWVDLAGGDFDGDGLSEIAVSLFDIRLVGPP